MKCSGYFIMYYMVHVLAASYDYPIGDEGVNTLVIWILVVRPGTNGVASSISPGTNVLFSSWH